MSFGVINQGENLWNIAKDYLTANGLPATPTATRLVVDGIAQKSGIANPNQVAAGTQFIYPSSDELTGLFAKTIQVNQRAQTNRAAMKFSVSIRTPDQVRDDVKDSLKQAIQSARGGEVDTAELYLSTAIDLLNNYPEVDFDQTLIDVATREIEDARVENLQALALDDQGVSEEPIYIGATVFINTSKPEAKKVDDRVVILRKAKEDMELAAKQGDLREIREVYTRLVESNLDGVSIRGTVRVRADQASEVAKRRDGMINSAAQAAIDGDADQAIPLIEYAFDQHWITVDEYNSLYATLENTLKSKSNEVVVYSK